MRLRFEDWNPDQQENLLRSPDTGGVVKSHNNTRRQRRSSDRSESSSSRASDVRANQQYRPTDLWANEMVRVQFAEWDADVTTNTKSTTTSTTTTDAAVGGDRPTDDDLRCEFEDWVHNYYAW